MAKKTKKKAHSKNSFLSKQKLNKRSRRYKIKRKIVLPGILAVLGSSAIISAIWLLSQIDLSTHQTPYRISLAAIDNPKISNEIQRFFDKNPILNLDDADSISGKLQAHLDAKSISLISISQNEISVHVAMHEPIAAIRYGKDRLLSKEGKVFGTYDEIIHQDLPLISGFTIDEKIRLNPDRSIVLKGEDQASIEEAILLIEEGLRYNINYRAVNLDPYRGFQVLLKDKRIRVEMGRTPFKKRYIKLVKILTNLDKKKVQQARIELDFNGKAFIKEFTF